LILLVIQGIAFVLIMSSLEVLLELLELNILRQLIKVIRQAVKEVLMQPLARLFPHINHHLGLLESWSYLLLSDLLCSFDIKCHQALGLDFSIIFITSIPRHLNICCIAGVYSNFVFAPAASSCCPSCFLISEYKLDMA
jgi:hypothetical protein